jgi:hypothetical protein
MTGQLAYQDSPANSALTQQWLLTVVNPETSIAEQQTQVSLAIAPLSFTSE